MTEPLLQHPVRDIVPLPSSASGQRGKNVRRPDAAGARSQI